MPDPDSSPEIAQEVQGVVAQSPAVEVDKTAQYEAFSAEVAQVAVELEKEFLALPASREAWRQKYEILDRYSQQFTALTGQLANLNQ